MPAATHTHEPRRELAVTYVPTELLIPYGNNARHHSRRQIHKIARSLDVFGWTNPPIVTRKGEVICGHGRLEAAKLRGLPVVPVIVIDDLSDAERRAYILADNEIAAKGSWDRGMLATELQGLIDLGFDVELTGFDTIEIDTLLTVGEESSTADDEAVDLPDEEGVPVTRLGDHWVIGRHHLLCADATRPESYELLLGDVRPELAFLDPPYNVAARRISGSARSSTAIFCRALESSPTLLSCTSFCVRHSGVSTASARPARSRSFAATGEWIRIFARRRAGFFVNFAT